MQDLAEAGELILLLFPQIPKHLDRRWSMARVVVVSERKQLPNPFVEDHPSQNINPVLEFATPTARSEFAEVSPVV
jgi:hypothetical protein